MNINNINELCCQMRDIAGQPNAINIPIPPTEVTSIRERILLIATSIEHSQPFLHAQLIGIKDALFMENPINRTTSNFYINPVVFGQGIAVLDILLAQNLGKQSDWCHLIHPQIAQVSQKLYLDGSYANAACDAFIEVNHRVKRLFQVIKPGEKVPDGDAAMKTVFSTNAPLVEFCDRSTDSGTNTQKGFMEMLAGAMSALRNPKAHANITIDREDAMRRLIFASMLMYKIDEAVCYSKIVEPPKS